MGMKGERRQGRSNHGPVLMEAAMELVLPAAMEAWIDLARCRQQWRNGLTWLNAGSDGGMD
eukprot:775033-Pelagomonas_calceolata.AAC.1